MRQTSVKLLLTKNEMVDNQLNNEQKEGKKTKPNKDLFNVYLCTCREQKVECLNPYAIQRSAPAVLSTAQIAFRASSRYLQVNSTVKHITTSAAGHEDYLTRLSKRNVREMKWHNVIQCLKNKTI